MSFYNKNVNDPMKRGQERGPNQNYLGDQVSFTNYHTGSQVIVQEPDFEIETVTEVLNVYSGDRNPISYPSPNYYVIDLISKAGKTFKNVKSVRLLSGIFPDQANVGQEPFLILNINEFGSGMTGTNNYLQEGSSILQLDRAVSTGNFFNLKTDICKSIFHNYQNSIAEISRLTISIRDADGNLFNFGADSNPPLKSLQHLISLEIVMETKKPTFRSSIVKTFG